MDLLTELVKLAAALVQLVVALKRVHPEKADDVRSDVEKGR